MTWQVRVDSVDFVDDMDFMDNVGPGTLNLLLAFRAGYT
jgi:hypothetical protein